MPATTSHVSKTPILTQIILQNSLASQSTNNRSMSEGTTTSPVNRPAVRCGIYHRPPQDTIHLRGSRVHRPGRIDPGTGLITYTEDDVQRHLSEQRTACEDRTPILVTHTLPFGILDIGKRFGQQHIGSKAVRSFIDDIQPPVTVCGHCHQFGGRAETLEYGTAR